MLKQVQNKLVRLTTPLPGEGMTELRYWQERIIYSFLLIGVTLGLFVLVPSVALSFREGLIVIAILDIAIYAWVLVLFFCRFFPYRFRVLSVIVLSFVLGLVLLIVTGPFGAGPTWLFFFPVLTGLLLEFRYAIASLLINTLSLLVFGWLIAVGLYDWSFVDFHALESWIVISLNFLLLNAVATVAIVMVVQGLQASLLEKQAVLSSLEARNVELRESNEQLQSEIETRLAAQENLHRSEAALKASEIQKSIAEKANRAISEWVNFIAHEIRTPVSAPLGFARLGIGKLDRKQVDAALAPLRVAGARLKRVSGDEAGQCERQLAFLEKTILKESDTLSGYFERIQHSALRLNRLLNELLDLSKLEAGRMVFDMQPMNMRTVIADVTAELEPSLLEKQLELHVDCGDGETIIEGDGFRIAQLLQNLFTNAIKFSPQGKSITILCENSEIRCGRRLYDRLVPALKVTVADQGIGIPEDQIEMVFAKFKQSRKTRQGEGTGLGLPICREIVIAHSGRIWVESTEQAGSRFHFELPLRQERRVDEGENP